MKILNSSLMRQLDAYTIEHEPISSIKLMERAAAKCAGWISENIVAESKITFLCGLGNNGGDGLAIARLLPRGIKDYKITIVVLRHSEKSSDDFRVNEERIQKSKKKIYYVNSIQELPAFDKDDIIVDAIFGSGLSKPVEGLLADVIQMVNSSGTPVISIDLPSGLFSEDNSSNDPKAIVNADTTLTFQCPKPSYFFPETNKYFGDLVVLDIGLHSGFMNSLDSGYFLVEKADIQQSLKGRSRFSHKGTYGHALLISGSYGKMGAAVLGAKAALRSGAGLVTTHIPKLGYQIMQTSVPEAMVSLDDSEEFISVLPDISKYNAIAIGPGIDQKEETKTAMKLLIQNSSIPIILDADALNILSENQTWLAFLPKGSILTPHPKEFERLAGKPANTMQRLQMQKEFSVKFGVYIIYKGAFSTISTPDGKFYFNPTGNPGMATGGSGDVLTGILLGLKACNYSPLETCIIGAYIHGLSGDIALGKNSMESLIAGDIIKNLGKAFKSFSIASV